MRHVLLVIDSSRARAQILAKEDAIQSEVEQGNNLLKTLALTTVPREDYEILSFIDQSYCYPSKLAVAAKESPTHPTWLSAEGNSWSEKIAKRSLEFKQLLDYYR